MSCTCDCHAHGVEDGEMPQLVARLLRQILADMTPPPHHVEGFGSRSPHYDKLVSEGLLRG